MTAVPTAMAVLSVGATPRLVDVELATCSMDPASLAREIGPRTRAVIPVHLYGQCADLDAIGAIAAQHGAALLEDCAQAHGARDRERPAGTVGAAGAVSFYPTKNLGAFGDAGAFVTNDAALAERFARLRNYGNRGGFDFVEAGPQRTPRRAARRDPAREAPPPRRRQRAAPHARRALSRGARRHGRRAARRASGRAPRLPPVRDPQRAPRRAARASRGARTCRRSCTTRSRCTRSRRCGVARCSPPSRCARPRPRARSRRCPIYPELPASHQAQVIDAVRSFG